MAPDRPAPFYDAVDVHERYMRHRADEPWRSPNIVMEEPAIIAALGSPAGLSILDLGCGDGRFGRYLLAAGAHSYHGIDNAQRMIHAATATLAGTGATLECADIKDLDIAVESVDLITARLSLHYVADLDRLLGAAARGLVPGGRIIFTVVHPVITSNDNQAAGPRTTWTVDNYFVDGPRVRQWMGSEVVWHHRTTGTYVQAIAAAGLTLSSLSECEPQSHLLQAHPDELQRRRRVPLFLLIDGRK